MARSTQEIENQIKARIASTPIIGGLYSPSKVGTLNQFIFVIATIIHYHEQLWDQFKKEVEDIVALAPTANSAWLRAKVLAFQFGDAIKINPLNWSTFYDVVDPAKRIITRVSIEESKDERKTLIIKIAKGQGDSAQPLTPAELTSFTAYMNEVRVTGITHSIISLFPDRLYVNANIYYNGQFPLAEVKQKVKNAIISFLANLDFNATVYRNDLIDAIQAVPEVKDVKILSLKAREQSTPFISSQEVDRFYTAKAGYFITEDTTSNTLNESLTFFVE